MADHGQLINTRHYWMTTDAKGKAVAVDQPPANGSTGVLGIGGKPNTPATEYEERVYEDGTKVVSHWDSEATTWKQDSIEVDKGLAAQHKDQQKPTAGVGQATAPPNQQWIVRDDGSKFENPNYVVPAVKPTAGVGQATAPPTQRFIVRDDGTQFENPNYVRPEGPVGNVPALNLGNPRTGQRTDLNVVESEANAFIASLNADKNLTPEERTRRLTAYIATTVKPAVDKATAEVNAEADRARQRQVEQDARAAEATGLANRRENRIDTAAERTAAEATRVSDRKFAYDAGQDAVSSAMKLMPYRVGPGYNDAFAGVLNSMGGPQISGRALDVQMPDFSAIARHASEQAWAIHGAPVAQPGAAPAPVPPGLATLPVAAPAGYMPPPMAMPPSNAGYGT